MLFIHCQQEEGHHDQHHTHGGHAVSRRLTEQKEQRYAYKRPGGKADQLPSGQIELLWSSIFVTLMANKIGGLQFGIYRNCQISSRVFHTAVAALPLTKANRSDFE